MGHMGLGLGFSMIGGPFSISGSKESSISDSYE